MTSMWLVRKLANVSLDWVVIKGGYHQGWTFAMLSSFETEPLGGQ